MEPGFFQLKNAVDLFKKLEWEYHNLAAHPGNAWHAFNFFVTAEHMAEWKDWRNYKSLKTSDPLLALCSHIASGGKHFNATHKNHTSVASAKFDGVYEPGIYEEGVFEESLLITLCPEAEATLGIKTIDAVTLASKILEYWRQHV